MERLGRWSSGAALAALLAAGCVESGARSEQIAAQSCMTCHNGSDGNDYAGPGIEDPHPFGSTSGMLCTTCHGGNPAGDDVASSHVPPPPEIGDRNTQNGNNFAWFNRLTLTGLDKLPDYQANGQTYTALDYLQFINPGDLRVVDSGRSCGQCHAPHVNSVTASMLATEAGIFSGATYAIGAENAVPANQGLYEDTAADLGFRAETDPNPPALTGAVSELLEFPVFSVRGANGPDDIFQNAAYHADQVNDDRNADNTVVTGSALANLYHEQVAFTCGDCHLGSAGANNRYGDFRSSGCTACHMPYSLDGRSRSGDPNVDLLEPADPDDIDPPERPHIRRHRIHGVAKTVANGEDMPPIDDYTCAGCHQGSNRTVMQYWGIRLDQNEDLRRGVQYPAMPESFVNTNNDPRLFDPAVGNRTFNGRDRDQYIRFEDYDGDLRDDTPADVHYDAGLGCIDCHGSHDMHGGNVAAGEDAIFSRMEQVVSISCESCHGDAGSYAPTAMGTTYDGTVAELAVDREGNALRHVVKEGDGYFLYSRLTGNRHYVPQTRDVVVDSGATNPLTGEDVYSVKASYAMGRADGDPSTGIGPLQTAGNSGFSHGDNVSCVACHASWTNSCIGCHLEGEYNGGANFSNITGQRIVFREKNADFVYQSPVPFQLGIGPDGEVEPIAANTDTFFLWEDRNNDRSDVFAFSDRNGAGNDPGTAFPSLSHNVMMPHSIRGKVEQFDEGPRYCVACHLTDGGLAAFGTEYDTFRTAMGTNDFASLDFTLLQEHIGKNPGNQLDSPLWVHMAAGLGSGLFLFDEDGCPVNPLDTDDDRAGCNDVAPANNFDLGRVHFNMDRIVDGLGRATGSNNHPMLGPGLGGLRDGSTDPNLSGPLGLTLIQRLTDPTAGIVLDSWIDADGVLRGDASTHVPAQ